MRETERERMAERDVTDRKIDRMTDREVIREIGKNIQIAKRRVRQKA